MDGRPILSMGPQFLACLGLILHAGFQGIKRLKISWKRAGKHILFRPLENQSGPAIPQLDYVLGAYGNDAERRRIH